MGLARPILTLSWMHMDPVQNLCLQNFDGKLHFTSYDLVYVTVRFFFLAWQFLQTDCLPVPLWNCQNVGFRLNGIHLSTSICFVLHTQVLNSCKCHTFTVNLTYLTLMEDFCVYSCFLSGHKGSSILSSRSFKENMEEKRQVNGYHS